MPNFREGTLVLCWTPEKPQAVPEFQLAAEHLPFVPVPDKAAGQYFQGSLPRQPRRWEAVNHTVSRAGNMPDEFLLDCFQLLQPSGPELEFFPPSNEKPSTWRLHHQSVLFPWTKLHSFYQGAEIAVIRLKAQTSKHTNIFLKKIPFEQWFVGFYTHSVQPGFIWSWHSAYHLISSSYSVRGMSCTGSSSFPVDKACKWKQKSLRTAHLCHYQWDLQWEEHSQVLTICFLLGCVNRH